MTRKLIKKLNSSTESYKVLSFLAYTRLLLFALGCENYNPETLHLDSLVFCALPKVSVKVIQTNKLTNLRHYDDLDTPRLPSL